MTAEVDDVWLEVGFGGGEHLLEQARANPRVGLIGAEPYEAGVANCCRSIDGRPPPNIRIHEGDARDIMEALPDASLGRVFILFPDPWPKTRHHKRRFVQTEMLDALARVMKPGAELRFASDDAGYVDWTLERAMAHPAFRLDGRARRRLENPPARLAADPLRGQGAARPAGLSPFRAKG